jgi:ferredoxin
MPRYRIQIDRSLCSGFGSCVDAAPDAFALGGDGVAAALDGRGDERALEAARGCPMGAIAVFDADTGEQVA